MKGFLQISEPGAQDRKNMDQTIAVGIDLGTTHSLVAVVLDGKPTILTDETGHTLLPSVVSYHQDTPQVGRSAEDQSQDFPDHVIRSVKRMMGQSSLDMKEHTQRPMIPAGNGDKIIRLQLGNTIVTPVEISAEILKQLKRIAEEQLGQPVKQAVITVPAYFNEGARTATRDAAKLAGLDVLRLINEPTAAALAYGLDSGNDGIYVIYDLGGGTFDISILRLEKGIFQVLATGGDTHLGGDDFDRILVEKLLSESQEHPQKILLKAKKIKHALSHKSKVSEEGKTVSQDQFHNWIQPLVQHTLDICKDVLTQSQIHPSQVDGIVLVGGSTRTPYIAEKLKDLFGKAPLNTMDPDLAVAYGAALQAHALTQGSDTLLLDVTPLSIGLETMGGIVEKIIHRNTPIPVSKSQEFTTYQNGQTAMGFHVVQGEREIVDQCRSLCRFELTGIPPKVAGAARINVTFTIDADGLLTVSAQDSETGNQQSIHVKPSYGLSDQELATMIMAGYENADADMKDRLLREACVDGERLLNSVLNALTQDKNLLSSEMQLQIEENIRILRENIALKDINAIKQSCEILEESTRNFAEIRMNKAIQEALKGQHIETIDPKDKV